MLRVVGIDADITDLSPINPILFKELKKFDLIHTTDQLFAMAKTAKRVSKKFNIPLTTSFHTDAPAYSEFYVKKILNYLPKILSKFMIKKLNFHQKVKNNQKNKILNYFIMCEKVMMDKSFFSKKYLKNCSSKNIIQLERGVDKKKFRKKKINKNKILKKYNLSNSSKIIFFCGRIHELKGALFLAKIHKLLIDKGHDVGTFLAGDNLQGKECKELGGENIFILDYLSEVEISTMMNMCDLFVFPSLYETGPQVVLEAKQCESVCVVSPGGGGRQIRKSGIDGVIIKDYEVQTWFKIISNLLYDSKTLNSIKIELRNDNKQKSWKDIYFLRFDSVWKDLLSIK